MSWRPGDRITQSDPSLERFVYVVCPNGFMAYREDFPNNTQKFVRVDDEWNWIKLEPLIEANPKYLDIFL